MCKFLMLTLSVLYNRAKAIEAFKKALTPQAIPETKEKIDKLLKEDKEKVK
jgi:uncharacterized protein